MWVMESILERCLHNCSSGSGCRKKSDLSLVNTVNDIYVCMYVYIYIQHIHIWQP